ncbi:MAG TPA: PAS domain S-box protein [Bacteroidota bacterium]|nr:PAS domain S-box protein [Bacteroidota bacterium]
MKKAPSRRPKTSGKPPLPEEYPLTKELFHFVSEHAEDLIAITDINGKRLYNSASYKNVLGIDIDAIAGTDAFEEIHPEDRDRIKKIFQTTIKTGAGSRAEFRFRMRDGSVRYIESQGNAIRGTDGKISGILTVSRDITERKQSENKLRLLAYALSCTRDCFCLTDLNETILLINNAFVETYGYSEEELIGKNISIVRSPHTPNETLSHISPDTLSGGWNGELLNRRKDGSEFPIELWTSVVRDDQGTPIGLVGIARDISDRKAVEETLAYESSLWHTLMDNIPDTIYFKDAECRFTRINKAQAMVLGIPRTEDALGKTDSDFFSTDHARQAYLDEKEVITSGKAIIGKVERVTSLDGIVRWFSTTKLPIRNTDGSVSGIVGSSREITDLMVTEHQLKESEAKYRLLFESNPEAMWVYDIDTLRFLAVNDAAVRRYGWTRDEFLKMTVRDIRPAAELEKFQEHLSRRLSGPEEIRGFRHRKKDGSIIDVEILAHPITFTGRNANLIIAKDITDRRRAEILQESVYKIAEAAGKPITIEELFREVHEIIKTVMPADNFYIALYDDTQDLLSFPYFVDEADEPFPPSPPGRGLTAYVLRTGRSLLCDKQTDEELQRKGEVELVGASSPIWLGVPLVVENKTIGVMTVQHYSDPHAYGTREQHMLEYVSSQVAKAIELKRTEASLRQNEERLRTFVSNAPMVLFAVDQQGIFTLSEGRGLSALNLKAGQAVGKSVFELYKNYPQVTESIRRALSGETFTATVEVDELAFESHYTPIRDDDGTVTGVIGVSSNISERREAEQLQNAVYSISEAADGSVTLDDLYRRVHEIVSSVMPGRNFYIALYDEAQQMINFPYFVDEVDVEAPPQQVGKGLTAYVLRTGQSLLCDDKKLGELISRGDAESVGAPSPIWLGVPLIAEKKTIGAMVVQHYTNPRAFGERERKMLEFVSSQVAKAIDKKRGDKALFASEQKYRTLFEESKDGIFLSTPEGKLLDVNPAGVQLFGYSSKQEMLQRDIANDLYFNPADRDSFKKILTDHGYVVDFEYEIKTMSGERRVVLENASTVKDAQGAIVAYRGYVRDITERKKLEDQLRQAQKMESIGTLAGGIAHDFNNLLGIILGYASLLEDDRLSKEKSAQSIETIKKAAERGANLVRQLLTFARKSEAWFESVNANDTITELVKMLQQTFPKTITITSKLDPKLPSIVADSGQLHQAMLNLCVNSRDAVLERNKDGIGVGQLTLGTGLVTQAGIRHRFPEAASKEYIDISVSDSGIGMNEETRLRIFEPFYTTKELGKGTGLGLSVVYGVINNHRGFIDVESEAGRGTTFHLYFPVKTREIQADRTTAPGEASASQGNETVLIVEDEEMLLDLVKALLEDRGYNVMTARDGQEGIDVYSAHHEEIACVLTDMGLPKLGGWEMFLRMKQVNPGVKAVLASGYCDPKIRTEMISEGAKDFISKPYVAELVLKRIREVIDNIPGN